MAEAGEGIRVCQNIHSSGHHRVRVAVPESRTGCLGKVSQGAMIKTSDIPGWWPDWRSRLYRY